MFNLGGMEFFLSVLAGVGFFIAMTWLLSGVRFVSNRTYMIVELFGKFHCAMEPGLNITWPYPISQVSDAQSSAIQQRKTEVVIKTSDDAFVTFPVAMQYQVVKGQERDAYYELEHPVTQMMEFLKNRVRSEASSLSVEDLYKDKSGMATAILNELTREFLPFGFKVLTILVDEPTLPPEVQDSYNSVIAAKRDRDAAKLEGETIKLKMTGKAEGEAASLKLKGEGYSDMRAAITKGLTESLTLLKDAGMDIESANKLMLQIDANDTIRDASEHGAVIITAMGSGSGNGSDASSLIPQLVAALEASKKTPSKASQ